MLLKMKCSKENILTLINKPCTSTKAHLSKEDAKVLEKDLVLLISLLSKFFVPDEPIKEMKEFQNFKANVWFGPKVKILF